ncbi:hypothetical protein D1013_02555 [Euzebyella marina]|uniref:Carbohydrate-binding domain-containing protein n=1 Tax=Euzebyella marina TaxID=1761453 RepID=A0A3G2L253_9FLAO|nr:carbohydrate-binding family 9-like protein [Euzebyella marina]AYN66344.1 hypothetical protein D1013_02555 [Euzebyella marina]
MGKYIAAAFIFIYSFSMAQTDTEQKSIVVKQIVLEEEADLETVSRLLEAETEINNISLLNWDVYSYLPKVHFRIARNKNDIWLKFYVSEENVLAQFSEPNSSTHRDSCVEFFIDPLQDGNYYNFEFNCIGTTHLAYGPGRGKRTFIDKDIIKQYIKVRSSLGNIPFEEKGGGHDWEMTVVISEEVWTYSKDFELKGLKSKANFYKCGDDTSKPHYVSWNAIDTERPDFHRPEFFGSLTFE